MCGPLPELRIRQPAQMLYLFLTSIVPTVPGAWLTFAEGAVYQVYDIPAAAVGHLRHHRPAGRRAIMKLGAGAYLWVLIASSSSPGRAPSSGPTGRRPWPADRLLLLRRLRPPPGRRRTICSPRRRSKREFEQHPAPG